MKSQYALLAVCCIILCCCSPQPPQNDRKIISPQPQLQRFIIENHHTYKIIHVFADKNSGDTTYSYVLYHRGTVAPSVTFKAQYVETPVERVACLSNIYVGCLQKLKLEDKVVAVDNINYVCNEAVRNNYKEGKVKELSKTSELNIEETILLRPDVVFAYGSGNIEKDIDKRLPDAKIPVVISVDHYETTPIARASWIRFIAAFFEKDELADSLLAATEKNYQQLKQLASGVTKKPGVITEIKYNDTWYVPGGKSFMAQLLKDAGAYYYWQNDTNSGSLALSYENVYLQAVNAEYWLNLHEWNKPDDCVRQDERNKNFKAYTNKNLYNNDALNNGVGGNAYWETGLISADEILKDLIKIFHPELLPDHKLKYYRKLN